MLVISLKNTLLSVLTALFLVVSFVPTVAFAQDQNFSLSVTPPFFQMTITPGEEWSSFIKLVNVNDFPITLYASVVNFEANDDENGRGKFTPLLSEDPEYRSSSLAGWIEVTDAPITVGAGDTVRLPFIIRPPKNAPPGGHYAAILVGNQPVIDPSAGSSIAVSSLISSLIFARVQGDVDERGGIRDFYSDKYFYQEPIVSLSLRFENEGNVHLLPQGDIAIYNMWGKERGIIPVNQKTTFGNVLPKSVRKYNFMWSGEPSPLEIGRYKAVATLAFGNDSRQNISSITTFWVVPLTPLLSILGTLAVLVFLVSWFIRAYVRRALGAVHLRAEDTRAVSRTKTLTRPLVDGVMDLRNVTFDEKATEEKLSPIAFVKKYKLFFLFLLLVVFVSLFLSQFFSEVLLPERNYEIQVDSELSVPFSDVEE
jgi:hypothetical protein